MYLNKYKLVTSKRLTYWTLTWDVFKYVWSSSILFPHTNWTLTWDVFKYSCVGIDGAIRKDWTLTWDVFKYS